MADFQRKERVKNILDHRKLNLSTNCPSPAAKGAKSSLIWGVYANNPRLTVYTNDPDDQGADKNYGKISANLDPSTFFTFLNRLGVIADGPSDVREKVDCLNFIFPGGKRSEAPVLVSELWYGKDKEGIVFISVVAKDKKGRPVIKFPFGPGEFHTFVRSDGTPFSEAELSVGFAKGYVNMLTQLVPLVMEKNYVEPPPRDAGAGNGQRNGGGNNYGGNRGGNSYGGGGGNNRAADQDDDLPF